MGLQAGGLAHLAEGKSRLVVAAGHHHGPLLRLVLVLGCRGRRAQLALEGLRSVAVLHVGQLRLRGESQARHVAGACC
jgi:hypothetical protein